MVIHIGKYLLWGGWDQEVVFVMILHGLFYDLENPERVKDSGLMATFTLLEFQGCILALRIPGGTEDKNVNYGKNEI